jgi:hypothetical protein
MFAVAVFATLMTAFAASAGGAPLEDPAFAPVVRGYDYYLPKYYQYPQANAQVNQFGAAEADWYAKAQNNGAAYAKGYDANAQVNQAALAKAYGQAVAQNNGVAVAKN